MINSVLIVCVGNICRSPLGAAALTKACPRLVVGSAGLRAVVGATADQRMAEAALEIDIDLSAHVATQITRRMATTFDLILVMQASQRNEIRRLYPEAAGRTMLLGQWVGSAEIADPFRLPLAVHRHVRDEIIRSVHAWTEHF